MRPRPISAAIASVRPLATGLAAAARLFAALPLLAAVAVAAPAVPNDVASLDRALSDTAFWKDGSDVFMHDFAPLGFQFVSGRDIARSTDPGLRFLGFPVVEAFADFKDGKVSRVRVILYDRGDDTGSMGKEAFGTLVEGLSGKFRAWAGNAGRPGSDDEGRSHRRRRQWKRVPSQALLAWAYTGGDRDFRAEYVRVTVAPAAENTAFASVSEKRRVTSLGLRQRIMRMPNGDVLVDGVPMVDQGQKGYCAAATAERLLRYYGRSVDQHDIAQLANTAREGGTSSEGMARALSTAGKQYDLYLKNLYAPDWKDFMRLIGDYNRQAKKRRVPALPDPGNTIDVGALYEAMDSLVLKDARAADKSGFKSFHDSVKTYIDSGVPLIWSCILGKFPENPPLSIQGAGGHMRMIVGYNAKTAEILYSDSWGPGHELKRMPEAEAWAILTGLYVLKPADIR